jgi:FkbM family methyltransferase
MAISRKGFLLSSASAAAGVALGVFGKRKYLGNLARGGAADALDDSAAYPAATPGANSYAQCGEDVNVDFTFRYLNVDDITYLDIGAHHPTLINNTYFFYRAGHRGVLVEPNVAMCELLRSVRPEDKTLVAGIGVTAVREADYYLMTESAWNTFSREEAEHQVEVTKGAVKIKNVTKVPLLDINEVMEAHFKGAPAFLSLDAEGLHLAILKTIDFTKYRPKAICVETLISGSRKTIPEIPAFMETQGYVARGGSLVNTIFIDSRLI